MRKKGGVKSIELETIKKNSPNPLVKMFGSLKLDENYNPSNECIKLQKVIDDYDKGVKLNIEMQLKYNQDMHKYHEDLKNWHNSQEYEEQLEGMYYSSLSDERRRELQDLVPVEPSKPKLKILKKPSKQLIQLAAKECGKHFIQDI